MPGAEEAPTGFAFAVPNKGKLKGFVWVWMERVAPKKPRVPNAGVIAYTSHVHRGGVAFAVPTSGREHAREAEPLST